MKFLNTYLFSYLTTGIRNDHSQSCVYANRLVFWCITLAIRSLNYYFWTILQIRPFKAMITRDCFVYPRPLAGGRSLIVTVRVHFDRPYSKHRDSHLANMYTKIWIVYFIVRLYFNTITVQNVSVKMWHMDLGARIIKACKLWLTGLNCGK